MVIAGGMGCAGSAHPLSDGGVEDAGTDAGPAADGGKSPDAADSGYPYDDTTQVGAICHTAQPWAAGETLFEEVTVDAGLTGVQGTLISAIDLDGDGWADLVIRYFTELEPPVDYTSVFTTDIPPDGLYTDGGIRTVWILRNNQRGGFEDVTKSSGILQSRSPSSDPSLGRPGAVFAFGDVDNDGFIDVYDGFDSNRAALIAETSEILLNNGDGTFRLGPAAAVAIPDGGDTPSGASFVDFDRDGNLDLWVSEAAINSPGDYNYDPTAPTQVVDNHLWKGFGTGQFADVTASVGLATKTWDLVGDLNAGLARTWGWGSNACDLNNDGYPELLANSYARAPNHLFQAIGPSPVQPWFSNVSVASGYAFDQDMAWWNDQSARCWCNLHPGETDCVVPLVDGGIGPVPPPIPSWPCTGPAGYFRWTNAYGREPFELGGNYESTACMDMDNDGNIDLVTTADAHWDVGDGSDRGELLFNNGGQNVSFSRPGNDATGLARSYPFQGWNESTLSVSLFDFDGDGWPDVFWGNSEYYGDVAMLFHQDTRRHFSRVSASDAAIALPRAAGSAVADFFHDGRLSIAVGNSLFRCDPINGAGGANRDCQPTAQVHLYRNVYAGYGNFMELALTGGPHTNRLAIGARVTVTAGGITQTREVGGGYGRYGYQDDLVQHFAVGSACDGVVTIRWPDRALTTETFKLPMGHRFAITQGGKPTAVF
jgi:hypothetical protein